MGNLEFEEFARHENRTIKIKYYNRLNAVGEKRYMAIIHLSDSDSIIIDDSSLFALRAKARIICPYVIKARAA